MNSSYSFPRRHCSTVARPTRNNNTVEHLLIHFYRDICKIIIAIILPPLGVFLERGCGSDLLINILLTILGFVKSLLETWKHLLTWRTVTFQASSMHCTSYSNIKPCRLLYARKSLLIPPTKTAPTASFYTPS